MSHLPQRWKVWLWAIVCSQGVGKAAARIFGDRIPMDGMAFSTASTDIRPETRAAMLWGLYEKAEREAISKYLHGYNHVVDLGASIGVTGSLALKHMPPSGRLIAIEANPSLIRTLEDNLRRNALNRNYRIVQAAVASTDSEDTDFFIGWSTGSSLNELDDTADVIRVRARTLTSILEEYGIDQPFALLCDIEGGEAHLLWEDTLAMRQCHLFIGELHHTTFRGVALSPGHMEQRLQELGMKLIERRGSVVVYRREVAGSDGGPQAGDALLD